MKIDDGALYFEAVLDNGQINEAVEETLRRIQGLSDGTVAGGKKMDAAFDNTANVIRNALGQIGTACEMHEQSLQNLEAEYQRLGQQAGAAFMAGRDEEYQAITQQQAAIKGEMTVREHLIRDLQEQSNRLEDTASKMEENKRKVEENANAHVSMRTRIKEVREEMMLLVDQGIDEQSEAYQRLKNELGRLINIQGDVAQQGKILANDEQKYQGIIQGLSGLAGGFSAVTGTVSLFAGENEDLQKVMTKVQSVMAITIGLQQVAQTLNKDSAFQLVTLNGLKRWWAGVVAKATVAENTGTAAAKANTAAQRAQAAALKASTAGKIADTGTTVAQTTAATGGTVANTGLAGAFRMVGAAIKSIPVFGWIAAGISALIAVYSHFARKAREAKKAQEEFSKSVIEGSYKAIGTIEMLSAQFKRLGDDMKGKEKLVRDSVDAFNTLGMAVHSVAEAEDALIKNKNKFIDAQTDKVMAMVYTQQAENKIKEKAKAEDERDALVSFTNAGMIDNPLVAAKQEEIDKYIVEIGDLYEKAAHKDAESLQKMKDLGIRAINDYCEGTVGAIEQAIQEKQAALKDLKPNSKEWQAAYKEIEKLQKQIEKPTSGKSKDPFLEMLETRKKEYTRFMKWMNSGDEIIAKSANVEFAWLLKEGETYIDYLKKQREIILSVDVANRSKSQNQQLRTLNDQIAEETKKTVLESFNNELSGQLANAKTVLEMLNIIEQKRKKLANDGTDVDNGKKDTLDEAEKDAIQKQKEETDTLLDEYSSYLDQRVKLHQKYLDDIALLEKRKQDAQSPEEAAQVQRTIDNRTKQYEKDKKGTGDVDYDAMVQQYATFEQKKQSIIDEYDAKRKQAQEHGNTQLVEELNKAQAKALSSLAIDEMQVNPDWEKMFGNLDEISTKKLQELLDMVEGKTAFLGVDFDPKDLETIKNKVESIKNEIQERNPFKALISSIKDYSKATDDESKKKALTNMFESASGAIDLVSGALDAVVGGMEKMGIQMDEETQAIIGDIGGILDGASQLASGIATGNPLAIIQGGIGLLSSAFDLFNFRDRKAEKSIKKHKENIEALEKAYNQLEWAIGKALGGAVYKNQQAVINNMKRQQQELRGMIRDEDSKKKTDHGKINEWSEQIAELDRQIQDMADEISKDILQTDAKTFANELGDALMEAFSKGEDAAKAFDDVVNNVMRNAVMNQLKKRFLEQQLQGALDGLEKSMGYWSGDEFIFDGLTDAEIANFKNKVAAITSNFNQALGIYSDLFKDLELDKEDDTSLTGAVKGVSEGTASIVAGQMNAIRINQMEATAILRQQLAALATIANNTSYNFHLAKLERIVTLLENSQSSSSLRSQGL